jgi:RHS repeat-associated protein
LGNVRLTFTTKEDVEDDRATLETENIVTERAKFLNIDEAVVVNHTLFDHTSNGTTNETYNATRLVGGNTAEKFGLARSLSVMPGDEINMEVWAKYLDNQSSNWSGTSYESFLQAYTSASPPAGVIIDGGLQGSLGGGTFPFLNFIIPGPREDQAPKAYLNWIVTDRDFNPIIGECGFVQVGSTGTLPKENGSNVPHELLKRPTALKINQPGYVYIYLSNENATPVEVFFDDFKVEHIKSPIVQMDDYYPFGLEFNSYTRENSVPNRKKFNGIEEVTDLGLNVHAAFYRVDDPAIGRWWQIDPKPNFSWSSYSSRSNNPIRYSDPLGDTVVIQHKKQSYMYENGKLYQNGQEYTGKVKGFLAKSVTALDKLRTGGAEGKKLVGDLQSNAATTNIMKGSNGFTESGDRSGLANVVRWNPGNTSGGPNENGNTSRPAFIGLGHELAHSYDKVSDGKVDYAAWPGVTGAAKAEMFSTYIENKLRAENQIPLRTHYGINNSSGSPVYEGQLIYPGTRASTIPQFNHYVPEIDEWLPYVYQN